MAGPAGGLPDLALLLQFTLGAVVMRGAGCTINDMWDRDIDAKVSYCYILFCLSYINFQ